MPPGWDEPKRHGCPSPLSIDGHGSLARVPPAGKACACALVVRGIHIVVVVQIHVGIAVVRAATGLSRVFARERSARQAESECGTLPGLRRDACGFHDRLHACAECELRPARA